MKNFIWCTAVISVVFLAVIGHQQDEHPSGWENVRKVRAGDTCQVEMSVPQDTVLNKKQVTVFNVIATQPISVGDKFYVKAAREQFPVDVQLGYTWKLVTAKVNPKVLTTPEILVREGEVINLIKKQTNKKSKLK